MFPALIGNMFGCCETQNNSDLNKTEVFFPLLRQPEPVWWLRPEPLSEVQFP